MSQKATRKSQNATVVIEEKEKPVDNPVKEMKKKIAANAEKDKQAAEKADKPTEKNDKSEPVDKHKPTEKTDKNAEKTDKQEKVADKKTEKQEKVAEKKSEKTDSKSVEKKTEKSTEKKPEQADKDESKGDKTKDKQNAKSHNGTHNGAAAANGEDAHGTVSEGSEDELVIEEDELFPELTYDDSETDAEPDAPSRSLTRRSQVKVTKTPETPRPASEKESEDSKESKLLKLKEDVVPSDRKLRSADSPKPESKKQEKKALDSPKKQESGQEEEKKSPSKKDLEEESEKEKPRDGKPEEKSDKNEVEVVIDVESAEGPHSRTRARVSPYSRSRLERTCTSITADYTGNNSTMETSLDVSAGGCAGADDSGYLRGLRTIRARSSYKRLADITLAGTPRAAAGTPRVYATRDAQASFGRPTGAVVGRKRKPSVEEPTHATHASTHTTHASTHTTHASTHAVEMAEEASNDIFAVHGKRMKLLDRLSLSMPFRSMTRHSAEIVGINTDLPLTAPVASASFDSFDPERIKPAPSLSEPVATPLEAPHDRNSSRCTLM